MIVPLSEMPLCELGALIEKRAVSPVAVVTEVLDRIGAIDDKLHAYVTVAGKEALEAARRAEFEISHGRYRGPLHGVPIALKDNIATSGVLTTGESKLLANWVPRESATVVRRLEEAGAIVMGKTHLHEFAGGTSLHYGPTVNPWDVDRIPGSSSSGSAAAVAVGLCSAALGTDTGGSVRQPASLCGIVGVKPTFGRVSRHGVFPLAPSLDQVGPMTRRVADCAIVLHCIAGPDPKDVSTSSIAVGNYPAQLRTDLSGIKIGMLRGYFGSPLDDDVVGALAAAEPLLRELGASIDDVEVASATHCSPVYFAISGSEALAAHETSLASHYDEYGADLRKRLLLGLSILGTEYVKARQIKDVIARDIDAALAERNVLVCATLPVGAPHRGEEVMVLDGKEHRLGRIMSRFTKPFSVTGHPALSVPCGFTKEGLPIGMQIIARRFDELSMFQVGHAYEQAARWFTRQPSSISASAGAADRAN